jgi:hypothetical protein
MNFTVHSIMYFYYCMAAVGYFHVVRPFASFITTIQILQMVGGMTVLARVGHQINTVGKGSCAVVPANYKLGLAMYSSYFCLFAGLFFNKYCRPGSGKGKGGKRPEGRSINVGCADLKGIDELGHFRPAPEADGAKAKRT